MATGNKEVSNDELLQELKEISTDLQQIKKSLAQIGAEVHITHDEEENSTDRERVDRRKASLVKDTTVRLSCRVLAASGSYPAS